MKLKYLFSSLLASALLFAGCEKNVSESFDNIKLSQTYLSIPQEGGSVEVTVNATEDWEFITTASWPEVVTFAKDEAGKSYKATYDRFGFLTNPDSEIDSKTPSWVVPSVLKGEAGETKVTFTAGEAPDGRDIEIAVKAGNNKQFLKIVQGSTTVSEATCAEVIEGADGKTYLVSGTVTSIINTDYGNWYLNDGTGEIYVYGTLDANGAAKNFTSLGIEVGDEVTVQGPKLTYGTTVELVDVTVIKITKSLVKIISEEQTIAKEGGEFNVVLAYKGAGVNPSVPAEYRSWVSVVDVQTRKGVPTKIESNPADTAVVTLYLAPNEAGLREGSVEFTSGTSTVPYSFTQEGSIIDATAAEINAAEDGSTIYRLTGYITKDAGSEYGNIYIRDYSAEVYAYGVLNAAGETKKWFEMGINAGDIVTVTGPKTSFNGAPQLKNVSVEEHIKVTDISLADFRNLPDDKTAWYRISGKVGKSTESGTKWDEQYGNFALIDGDTEVYVYGVRNGWGGAKGEFGNLGVKEGDELTIVCYKTSYNGLIEADGCFYVSHNSGEGGDTPEVPGGAITIVLDAAERPCDTFPNTSAGETSVKTYTIGDYEWTFAPSSGNKFSWYTDGYILFGKQGGYILMPSVDGKKLTKVTILTGKNASTAVKVGIFNEDGTAVVDGGTVIQLSEKNSDFSWDLTGTEVNTKYQLRVDSAHNAQAQKLTLIYE